MVGFHGDLQKEAVGLVFSWDQLYMLVPIVMFKVNQLLILEGFWLLEPAVAHVLTQARLLMTALIAKCFLGNKLSWHKWLALSLLSVGVAIINISQVTELQKDETYLKDLSTSGGVQDQMDLHAMSRGGVGIFLLGVAYLMLGNATGGFAGVAMEQMLKMAKVGLAGSASGSSEAVGTDQENGKAFNLWRRNYQLSLGSIAFLVAKVVLFDRTPFDFQSGLTNAGLLYIFIGFSNGITGESLCYLCCTRVFIIGIALLV